MLKSDGLRRATAIATALLVALVVALTAWTARPAEAASRYKTVTKTFNNFSVITIPAGAPSVTGGVASPYPSPVTAGGFKKGKIKDVNVTLRGYSHTLPVDVDVLLVGPRGHNAIIMSDVGSSDDVSNITLGLDDEAAGSLPATDQLVSGTFKPTNSNHPIDSPDSFPSPAPAPSGAVALSTFDGSNPNGTWSLYVVDDRSSGDVGQLSSGWSLQIKARVRR